MQDNYPEPQRMPYPTPNPGVDASPPSEHSGPGPDFTIHADPEPGFTDPFASSPNFPPPAEGATTAESTVEAQTLLKRKGIKIALGAAAVALVAGISFGAGALFTGNSAENGTAPPQPEPSAAAPQTPGNPTIKPTPAPTETAPTTPADLTEQAKMIEQKYDPVTDGWLDTALVVLGDKKDEQLALTPTYDGDTYYVDSTRTTKDGKGLRAAYNWSDSGGTNVALVTVQGFKEEGDSSVGEMESYTLTAVYENVARPDASDTYELAIQKLRSNNGGGNMRNLMVEVHDPSNTSSPDTSFLYYLGNNGNQGRHASISKDGLEPVQANDPLFAQLDGSYKGTVDQAEAVIKTTVGEL